MFVDISQATWGLLRCIGETNDFCPPCLGWRQSTAEELPAFAHSCFRTSRFPLSAIPQSLRLCVNACSMHRPACESPLKCNRFKTGRTLVRLVHVHTHTHTHTHTLDAPFLPAKADTPSYARTGAYYTHAKLVLMRDLMNRSVESFMILSSG